MSRKNSDEQPIEQLQRLEAEAAELRAKLTPEQSHALIADRLSRGDQRDTIGMLSVLCGAVGIGWETAIRLHEPKEIARRFLAGTLASDVNTALAAEQGHREQRRLAIEQREAEEKEAERRHKKEVWALAELDARRNEASLAEQNRQAAKAAHDAIVREAQRVPEERERTHERYQREFEKPSTGQLSPEARAAVAQTVSSATGRPVGV